MSFQLAVVGDSGQVQLWDIRKMDAPEAWWQAHSDHVYTCHWHPTTKNLLATAGRDRSIKVWDLEAKDPTVVATVFSTDAVAKVLWRPNRKNQIAR